MSLWHSLRALFARATTADEPSSRLWFASRTQAGVFVDGDSMFRNAVVWACVQYLTRAIGQLPWRVLKELPSGGAERATTHPVDWLLHKRPNPEMGAMTFKQTLLGSALTRGNGYAEIQRDARNMPVALWPIATDRVQPKRREGSGELLYRIHNGSGRFVDLEAMDVFHLRGFPGPDGVIGLDVVAYAAQSIGWAQATELFGASFFGEGMNPAGVIETPKGMDQPGRDRLKAELENLYKGPRKANRTALLDAGMKWTRVSVQPNAAQFIESMQHQVEMICRWFGVPPHKVQHLLRATFSNIEHQSIEVVVDAIAPWAKLFEEEADYKLFGATNRQGFFTKIYLQGLMRGDARSRGEFYKLMRESGAISADEIRALEDLNPLPEGEGGTKYIVQSQYTTLARIGEDPPAAVAPAQTSDDAASDGAAQPPADHKRKIANGARSPN